MRNFNFLFSNFGQGESHLSSTCLRNLRYAAVALFILLGVGNVWGATVTINMSDTWAHTGTSGTGGTTDITKSGITISTAKGYKDGTNHVRVYSGTTLVISSAAGNITNIAITSTASGTNDNGPSKISLKSGQSGSYSYSEKVGTWTYASGAASVTFSTSAQFRFTQIVVTYTAAGPTITTSVSSLSDVGYSTDDFSQQVKSFTVSGSSLTANVTVTAPTNYEVCKTSGGTYTSSVSFDKGSGTLSAQTVYVRLQSGKTAGNYSGNVACTSTGATTKNVAVSGSVPFTVTWKANGTTHATTYVAYATGTGTALGSLPDEPDADDYCGDAFYGWYDGESYSNASVAPSVISTSTKITTDKTYNAVFADVSGSSESLIELVGFESAEGYTASTTYNSSSYYTGSTGSKWKINYGAFSTNNALVGSQSAQFRVYNAGNYGKLYNSVAYGTNITKIKFRGRVTNTKLDVLVKVSSDGSSWSDNIYEKSLKTTKDEYVISVAQSGIKYVRFEATGTKPSSDHYDIIIDSIALISSSSSYSNYATSCCTSLGSINGSVSWSKGKQSKMDFHLVIISVFQRSFCRIYLFSVLRLQRRLLAELVIAKSPLAGHEIFDVLTYWITAFYFYKSNYFVKIYFSRIKFCSKICFSKIKVLPLQRQR